MIDMGCYMQINSSSVLKPRLFGDEQKQLKKRARYFLEKDLVHFVASDMHNVDKRPPYMAEAYRLIKEEYGEQRAQRQIDVFAMLKTLWKRKFSIVLVALVFAIAAFGYSAFLAKKEYQSTSRIYVVSRQNQDNNALTNSDLQAGSYLVKDYREIILSQNVLTQAIEELKLDLTPAELSKKISVSVPTDTRILSITAKDGDPKEAARIANGLRNVL